MTLLQFINKYGTYIAPGMIQQLITDLDKYNPGCVPSLSRDLPGDLQALLSEYVYSGQFDRDGGITPVERK